MTLCLHRLADLPEGSDFLVQPCRNRPAEFARCPRCPPGACQRRLLPFPVSVMLIFKCFLVQVGDFYFFTALANKPPLKGEGDQRSWWRGSAEIFYSCFRFHGRNPSEPMAASSPFRGACCVNCLCVLVQPCRNRPAEFARTSLSAWGLPTPVVALACIGNVDIRLFFLCKWVTLFHTAFASLHF